MCENDFQFVALGKHCGETIWFRILFHGVFGLLCSSHFCIPPVFGQRMDSFEGGEPRWRMVETDCRAQLTEHEISLLTPRGGRTCELFEVDCIHGTMALLAYPIEPCAILNEFQPEFWTRCSSSQMRFGVRVVFPFGRHPVTDGRITTVLWGDSYSQPGQWEKLSIAELEKKLASEVVAIRQRFGSQVNLDGGFVDCVVLNAYTGPGRYRVQIDDLNLRGMVPLAALGNPLPGNWRQTWQWRPPVRSKADRFWAAPNKPPIWLQHRGESLPWLSSLGFSGIVTDTLPSREKLAEAHRAGVAIIAPPPPYPVAFPKESASALRGWLLGAALDRNLAGMARAQVDRVSAFPQELKRPLVAEALEDFFHFSRIADEVIVPQPLPVSSGHAVAKLEWLEKQLATTVQRSEGWVSVNIGVPPAIADQVATAKSLLDPTLDAQLNLPATADFPNDPNELFPAELSGEKIVAPLGFRFQATSAVLAGARGLLVRTFRPLEVHTPAENAQVAALRWVQNDLTLWGPWIVAGTRELPPKISNPHWRAGLWRVDESQLVVAQCVAPGSQFCVPATHGKSLELGLAGYSGRQQIFRLTSGSVERLTLEVSPAGAQWQVEKPEPIETFLITSDPKVLRFVRRHLETTAADMATNRLDIVTHNLSLAARITADRYSTSSRKLCRRFRRGWSA